MGKNSIRKQPIINKGVIVVSALTVEQLYRNYIESIPVSDQLQLIALISQHLVQNSTEQKPQKTRSLLELEGLGADIWNGVDAQEYVNELRDEWEAH
jgi:hypothetical protein